ncbi:MAG TPA: phospholipase D-like domain-containing protein [Bacteroidia bacterium]|nr:phospholipase D-like domain-containing protein [Bacteroidia bacterium]
MELSPFIEKSLIEFISGDNGFTPYLKGSEIVSLFNQIGILDIYDWSAGGLPGKVNRSQYVWNTLKKINGKKQMKQLLEIVFSDDHFANDEKKKLDMAVAEVNNFLGKDGYKIELIGNNYKVIGATVPDEIEVQVHFEDIQKQIIEQIRRAKFHIWVAVAWITDKDLMNELYKKKKEGLNIRLVFVDDPINQPYIKKFSELFEIHPIKPWGSFGNLMHNKFCIIDLKVVIHGSYNWTTKAKWNKETVAIDVSRELAEQYAEQFLKLIVS